MTPRTLAVLRLLLFALLALLVRPAALHAGTFGKVVPIGGHASDLALDEPRGVLYVANFTANRIDVVSLREFAIQRSLNVGAQPASVALSPDGKYLVVAHYAPGRPQASAGNALTVVTLDTGERRSFSLGQPPLGVEFGIDGRALVVTATEFLSFDPAAGTTRQLGTVSGLTATALPQPPATAPSQIVATSLGVSGDRIHIFGITDTFEFRYDSSKGVLRAGHYSATPPLGPRALSVNQDGSRFMAGWALNDHDFAVVSQFPNVTGALNVGSVQFDNRRGLLYAQMGEIGATAPTLLVARADNLAVIERLTLAENLSGESVMSSDGNTMYSISESGVTVLPVGQLGSQLRIRPARTQIVIRGSACDRSVSTQELLLEADGGPADFVITSDNPGVRISPSRGTAPAVVTVRADMNAFAAQKGTVAATLTITSPQAVNQITPVRVLVNSKDPDQRGNSIAVPGRLVDILAEPDRDRFFILRQDTNEVLVFNGTTFLQEAALPTSNTPKSMAVTFDRRWLLVGSENAQQIDVYDLETLRPDRPIRVFDYVQSIAASANAILVASRASGGGDNRIFRVDMAARRAYPLDSLGVFENKISNDTVLTASTNGRSILVAQADGNLMLYDAVQDTFTVSRREARPLLGAYAASNFDKFVVGDALLNASLVPERRFETETGRSSGFAFVDGNLGFRITAPSGSAPGVLQRVNLSTGGGISPTRTVEAPLLGSTGAAFTRTLAPLYSRSALVALTVSGFTVFPWDYDAATIPPQIESIANAADPSLPLAPGGLITITGNHLSPVTQATSQIPLPTALGDTCLTVNGIPVPMILASPRRINAQLPLAAEGRTTLVLRTPGGVSDNYNVTVLPAAPGVFRSGVAGPVTNIPTIVRASNGELVTVSNPIHRGDFVTIYATGLGRTNPPVEAGMPAPADRLATTIVPPVVTIGGVPVEVLFSGLVPNQIGVYQINIRVNSLVPTGLSVPLQIAQGGVTSSVPVRVVE